MTTSILPFGTSVRFDDHIAYLQCPYNVEFLQTLHKVVPANRHAWDKYHKEWRIDKEYWPKVEPLVGRWFSPDAGTPRAAAEKHIYEEELRPFLTALDTKYGERIPDAVSELDGFAELLAQHGTVTITITCDELGKFGIAKYHASLGDAEAECDWLGGVLQQLAKAWLAAHPNEA